MKSSFNILLTITLALFSVQSAYAQIEELQSWLATPPLKRTPLESTDFSHQALTKEQAASATQLLLADQQATLLSTYEKQWNNRELTWNELKMPFYYQAFGEMPQDGCSLFISLHGGGGAPAELNDQQYKNQQHLYDATMQGLEGIYLAPRAPANTWDLWHKEHIDAFLNTIIQLAVIKENVNPNKVYIMGYSAGGDGLYQLAPRMADRWAAAAMMAGHPGDASALSLRNTPFTIHVGTRDNAYNRNGEAKKWGLLLDSLEKEDPQGYVHSVHLDTGGHWMHLQDAVALPWMHQHTRNPIPQKIVWVQDNRHHRQFYWLGTPQKHIKNKGKIAAEYDRATNEIRILDNYSAALELYISDDMLNLDAPITVLSEGKELFKGVVQRSIHTIYKTLNTKGDARLTFPGVITITNNDRIEEKNN